VRRTAPAVRILVPRLVDEANTNPQCLNARAMLARFSDARIHWTAACYGHPDPAVARASNVSLDRLWRWRFWQWRMFLLYQQRADAIFYPGAYWFDRWALLFRGATGRRVPVIATLEGLAGDEARQRTCSDIAGHPVFCQQVPDALLRAIDDVLRRADHIVAISPFLARIGSGLYGEKFSVLPLGIDAGIFHAAGRTPAARFTVVGAGRLYEGKRPACFLELAQRFPQADFVWFGEGELRKTMIEEAARRGIANAAFPGAIPNRKLADELRRAHLFVLPSLTEGVPKTAQEAAGCGLPVVLFGHYEAPTVVDGQNGYVVWSDEELFARVGELVRSPAKAEAMGANGARLAQEWSWDRIAPRWEERIQEIAGGAPSGSRTWV
jgi:hypothetical protein